jgi:2-keto-3-deoxy-L-rhamnonate aldolase RhmA
MQGRQLLDQLRNGKRIYGSAIISASPLWPAVVKKAGLDFVFIDTEHVPIDLITLSGMCLHYSALGLPPVVRIHSINPYDACRVLDSGAAGILVPYVETAEQVKAMVGATKLRPLKGRRLETILKDANAMQKVLKEYIEARNVNNILMINIESVPALEHLDEILVVPGLDAVIIGPHDLSCSLGIPEDYQNPTLLAAVQKIISKAREYGLGVGSHFSEEPDVQVKMAEMGANIILHSSDISLYGKALKGEISTIRKVLQDEKEVGESKDHVI